METNLIPVLHHTAWGMLFSRQHPDFAPEHLCTYPQRSLVKNPAIPLSRHPSAPPFPKTITFKLLNFLLSPSPANAAFFEFLPGWNWNTFWSKPRDWIGSEKVRGGQRQPLQLGKWCCHVGTKRRNRAQKTKERKEEWETNQISGLAEHSASTLHSYGTHQIPFKIFFIPTYKPHNYTWKQKMVPPMPFCSCQSELSFVYLPQKGS